MKNLYKILSIKKNATIEQIKNAHRVLVKKHHPDKTGGTTTQDFLDIQKAYETLIKPGSRAFYDEHGFTDTDGEFKKVQGLALAIFKEVMQTRHDPDFFINGVENKLNSLIKQQETILKQLNKSEEMLVSRKKALSFKSSGMDLASITLDKIMEGIKLSQFQVADSLKAQRSLLKIIGEYEKGEMDFMVFNGPTISFTMKERIHIDTNGLAGGTLEYFLVKEGMR